MSLREVKKSRSFSGEMVYFSHQSEVTGTEMKFSAFIPSGGAKAKPALFWLSGLTCTEDNFMVKAGAQAKASQLDMILIAPDTSPRGLELAGEHDSYDFGSGAGFYVDATLDPFAKNYRMHSYIKDELVGLALKTLPIDAGRLGISGHSMGGLGALVFGLRYPDLFKSLSAFAPICNPMACPWGHKAFSGYLGPEQEAWQAYDPCHLMATLGYDRAILVDQGDADEFLTAQLKPENMEEICKEKGIDLKLRYQTGYDHSYFFIATFINDHLEFHHERLLA